MPHKARRENNRIERLAEAYIYLLARSEYRTAVKARLAGDAFEIQWKD